MRRIECDERIRPAVEALSELSGVVTRSSCEGLSPTPERSSHADLAYVLFQDPIPIAIESALREALGGIARVEPSAVYASWPEANRELAGRLAAEAAILREPWARWTARSRLVSITPLVAALPRIWAARGPRRAAWCPRCTEIELADPDHSPCPRVSLVESEDDLASSLSSFLDAEDAPRETEVLEREGGYALLARLERGDFGGRLLARWRASVGLRAFRWIRSGLRDRVREIRSAGDSVDLAFEGGVPRLRVTPPG